MVSRLLLSLALLTVLSASPAMARPGDRDRALAAATRDLCDRRVALLGETGNHGSGETLAFKAALVERLVDHCGFSAVLFEASVYDLLEVDRRRRAHEEADPALLASAIGQLWAGDREFQPLIAFLGARATIGQLTIAGMDNSVGSVGAFYSLDTMPADFTRDLPPAIVWTATIHAARSTVMDDGWIGVDDLGAKVARTYGDRAFVLSFAAAEGSYRQGRRNPPRTISAAPPASLEAEALRDGRDVAYVGPKALAALGTRSAALFMPDRRSTARWRDAVDGIVVFRTERPPIRLVLTP